MKNSLIILKFLLLMFIFFTININKIYAKDLNIKANEILTFDGEEKIIGKDNAEAKIEGEIEIFADEFIYYKNKNLLIAEGNVVVFDIINKIKINSKKITYNKLSNLIISYDKTFFEIENKYKINSSDVNYDIYKSIISSDNSATVEDHLGNYVYTLSFKYSNEDKILDGEKIELIDNEKNKYYVNVGKIKLDKYELLGKDIKIFLRNDTFGIPQNEPKLKGNSVYYFDNKTIIKKGIFTSCKENDNCPPWSITSKKITHDKNKREIHYENALLKLYNIPVLYFPKFFHPDPTVDRKSGFLMPTFGESKHLGASVNIPYFQVISESEDFTLKPRFFSNTEYLLQSEYRKLTKNSSHIADFSINKSDTDSSDGRKTHFFSNSKFELESNLFEESNLDVKIERVSNDNYTKLYSLELEESIISDTEVLENIIEFSGSQDNFSMNLSLESYETMNKLNSDRYEFVYPNYSITKVIPFEDKLLNNLEVSSSGNQKKYSTNTYEAVQINDLILSTENFINNFGFNNSLKVAFKNVNSDAENSSKLKDKSQSEILSLFSYDFNLPLIKESQNFKNYLIPKISLRHSPNDGKNLKTESRFLNSDNIFSLNRIGFNETFETGTSLTIGIDFEKKNSENDTIFSSKIGTVFRDEANENLPETSTLGKKQSDYVGEIDFKPNEIFQFNYNYSLNNDFDEFNFHKIENVITVNNFINTFSFYEENNLIGKKSYYENNLAYNFNTENSLIFKTRENKTDNLTEYYNLIYEYKNDCLTASIKYNKEYYSNNILKPEEELFFNITLIPLGSTKSDNILNINTK